MLPWRQNIHPNKELKVTLLQYVYQRQQQGGLVLGSAFPEHYMHNM